MRHLIGTWLVAGMGLWGGGACAGAVPGIVLESSGKWAPEAGAAPEADCGVDGVVRIGGNGTGTCCGGWQFVYGGVRPGQAYRIRVKVEHDGIESPWDSLVAIVAWHRWDAGEHESGTRPWNFLVPKPGTAGKVGFEGVVVAPVGVDAMTVRYTFRWSQRGNSRWSAPEIEATTVAVRQPVKVCVLSATKQASGRIAVQPMSKGLDLPRDVAESVDLWASLAQAACERKPQLIVTPEVVIGGKALVDGAVAVPGPATAPFERIAREHGTHLVLGVRERAGDAIYNSAVLVGPEGKVAGVYRKVHLASSEGLSGVSPGGSFPVFDTAIGRIGCLICMDTTVCESARMLALNGAEFICFPIMGDLRADRWSPGPPIFNEDRWKAIMRVRAIDNQVCMVVARNNALGSCIIDRKGDILAWNEGDREIIEATVPADDGCRIWDGGDFREVTFLLRRPHLYKPYCDEGEVKALVK